MMTFSAKRLLLVATVALLAISQAVENEKKPDMLSTTKCPSAAEDCIAGTETKAHTIKCDATHGIPGGKTGKCTCTCKDGYEGVDCAAAKDCFAYNAQYSGDDRDGPHIIECIAKRGTVGGKTGQCTCSCVNGFQGKTCAEGGCRSENEGVDCAAAKDCIAGTETQPHIIECSAEGGTVGGKAGQCTCSCKDGFEGRTCAGKYSIPSAGQCGCLYDICCYGSSTNGCDLANADADDDHDACYCANTEYTTISQFPNTISQFPPPNRGYNTCGGRISWSNKGDKCDSIVKDWQLKKVCGDVNAGLREKKNKVIMSEEKASCHNGELNADKTACKTTAFTAASGGTAACCSNSGVVNEAGGACKTTSFNKYKPAQLEEIEHFCEGFEDGEGFSGECTQRDRTSCCKTGYAATCSSIDNSSTPTVTQLCGGANGLIDNASSQDCAAATCTMADVDNCCKHVEGPEVFCNSIVEEEHLKKVCGAVNAGLIDNAAKTQCEGEPACDAEDRPTCCKTTNIKDPLADCCNEAKGLVKSADGKSCVVSYAFCINSCGDSSKPFQCSAIKPCPEKGFRRRLAAGRSLGSCDAFCPSTQKFTALDGGTCKPTTEGCINACEVERGLFAWSCTYDPCAHGTKRGRC